MFGRCFLVFAEYIYVSVSRLLSTEQRWLIATRPHRVLCHHRHVEIARTLRFNHRVCVCVCQFDAHFTLCLSVDRIPLARQHGISLSCHLMQLWRAIIVNGFIFRWRRDKIEDNVRSSHRTWSRCSSQSKYQVRSLLHTPPTIATRHPTRTENTRSEIFLFSQWREFTLF